MTDPETQSDAERDAYIESHFLQHSHPAGSDHRTSPKLVAGCQKAASDRTVQPYLILSSNGCLGAPGSSSQLLYPTWLCSDTQVHLQNLPLSFQIQQLLAGTLLLRLSSPPSSFGVTTISLPSNRKHHPRQKATAKTFLLPPLSSPASSPLSTRLSLP